MKLPACILVGSLSFLTMCESITVTGRIENTEGLPVAGATVIVNRTRQQAISDSIGMFSIDYSPLSMHDSRPNQLDSLLVTASGYRPCSYEVDEIRYGGGPIVMERE